MRVIHVETATGKHEPLQCSPELEGDSALECIALFAQAALDEIDALALPDLGFRAPLTIRVEEIDPS